MIYDMIKLSGGAILMNCFRWQVLQSVDLSPPVPYLDHFSAQTSHIKIMVIKSYWLVGIREEPSSNKSVDTEWLI